MSYVLAKDISKYQGNWQDTGEPIVMIKMSGGDDGLYMDANAASNYGGAVAAGRAVGGYHFAGWTNPEAEAAFFQKAMQPVAENDVYALDAEAIPAGLDPVAWCVDFTHYIYEQIGVWCLIYMNLSTLNSYDWSPVLANSGLWLADWAVSPDANIPTTHVYVMQQYSDGPNYDHDVWFGTVDQFKEYGYHAPSATPPENTNASSQPAASTNLPSPDLTSSSPTPPAVVQTTSLTGGDTTQYFRVTAGTQNAVQTQSNWFSRLIQAILDLFKGKR